MLQNLLLTDLDGTLTKGSLVLEHAGYLIKRKIIKDNGSFKKWMHDRKNETLITNVAENYRKELNGKQIRDLHVKQFVSEFLNNPDNWYGTLDELKQKRSTTDIYIISGSADYLVEELANQLNVKFYASKYEVKNGVLTGDVDGLFAEAHKDKCIMENFDLKKYNFVIGWGDTSSDYGIFKYCDYVRLVEPTTRTLDYITHKIKVNEILN